SRAGSRSGSHGNQSRLNANCAEARGVASSHPSGGGYSAMKLPAKNMSIGLLKHSTVRSGSGVRTIQPHGPQSPACRTPACKVSHSMEQRRGLPQGNQNLISHRGAADLKSQSRASRSGTAPGAKTANYNVLTPTPLGHGSQQIRATIHGTPQLAGSVDIRAAGFGKAYISNLRV